MGENIGKITQVLGPVVDVEFEQGKLPTIYTSLLISNPAINDEPDNLVIEVAQHLGDNVVRTIAMDVTDGLVRGMPVKDTGKPILMQRPSLPNRILQFGFSRPASKSSTCWCLFLVAVRWECSGVPVWEKPLL